MPTRRLLIAGVPLLFATAACSSADLFAGPDPLRGPPSLAPETVVLSAAITAEERLVAQYRSVLAGRAAGHPTTLLTSLLSQHEAHLTQLKARLVVPSGYRGTASASAAASASASGSASASAGAASSVAQLRVAEQASAAALTRQLTGVSPALAQLFASIAASDATHATALAAL